MNNGAQTIQGEPSDEPAVPPPTKKARRMRRSQLTISGGVVSPETIKPHANHPLGHLSPNERLDAAYEALGGLILKAFERGASPETG